MIIERKNFYIDEIDKDGEIEICFECQYFDHSIWLSKKEMCKLRDYLNVLEL